VRSEATSGRGVSYVGRRYVVCGRYVSLTHLLIELSHVGVLSLELHVEAAGGEAGRGHESLGGKRSESEERDNLHYFVLQRWRRGGSVSA